MSIAVIENLKNLRKAMAAKGIDGYLINGSDPHLSEYMPERWQSREFISGFTGSYGYLAFTQEEAVLWTDSRYYLQAEDQLKNTGIKMLKARLPESISPAQWLAERMTYGDTVAMDASCYSIGEIKSLEKLLIPEGVTLQYDIDLLDEIWSGRPDLPMNAMTDYPVENAGISRVEKIGIIRQKLEAQKCNATVITALDDIAWTFNVRGNDVECNPVVLAYGLITPEKVTLFVDDEKLDDEIRQNIIADGIELQSYAQFYDTLKLLKNLEILLDDVRTNALIEQVLCENNEIVFGVSVPNLLKATKNEIEVDGFRQAMISDGLALLDFQLWLEKELANRELTEFEIAEKLEYFRSKQDGYVGISFWPIVGYKDHGAIVHFHVTPETANNISKDGVLLFDSGGQYEMGTTDITRTIRLGDVSEQIITDFTLVLKGMIALSNVKFIKGAVGCHLDILARQALWQNGLNYGHGTGHGVGARLNVHEGPMSIRQELVNIMIQPGMVMSNEPGLYRENQYGIRTENVILCVEKETTEFGTFYGFESLTFYPIDTTLIDVNLLDEEEINWINNYHQLVKEKLGARANRVQMDLLERLTQPIK